MKYINKPARYCDLFFMSDVSSYLSISFTKLYSQYTINSSNKSCPIITYILINLINLIDALTQAIIRYTIII